MTPGDWISGAGVALSLLLSFLAWTRNSSEDLGGLREWRKMVEDTLKRYADHHAEHFDHAADHEIHWTERERETQTKQLDRIEELIKELLMPRSDWRNREPKP